ncbi:alpha/beta hydrolase [Amnibacterium sp. CER49]|uniref:alpha/beta fold hydrolase n=1 Tax=Amnibacterium sp. CER49 TaxID=3039161 RepID=UPI00244CFEF8|nr:alpha/beta hydrolase [Amnibacterium sp. CER49]MDH2444240.1 alpha/beta hydrolase [Amnibacterium sp. CER49]
MDATERDVALPDGRMVHAFAAGDGPVPAIWHHGSPQTGAVLPPLLEAGAPRGIRWLSAARPAYPGSTPLPGRDVAAAAADLAAVADAFGIDRFAVLGSSGGGPHALACAALLPGRVAAVVTFAGVAPFDGTDGWFAGMRDPRGLRASLEGRDARARYAEVEAFDESVFIAADWDALEHDWASLGEDAGRASADGADGAVDDDVAFVTPWGVALEDVRCPVLLVQGGEDRVIPEHHARRLLDRLPAAELWLRPRDGHISVLRALPVALDWIRAVG